MVGVGVKKITRLSKNAPMGAAKAIGFCKEIGCMMGYLRVDYSTYVLYRQVIMAFCKGIDRSVLTLLTSYAVVVIPSPPDSTWS